MLPSVRVPGKVPGEHRDRMGDELGARTPMGQGGGRDARCPQRMWCCLERMGRYLVKAYSACVSCLRSLPSKTQLRGEPGGGGEARSAVERTEKQLGRSY